MDSVALARQVAGFKQVFPTSVYIPVLEQLKVKEEKDYCFARYSRERGFEEYGQFEFPDLTQLTGRFIGPRYILVDFWATWCGPCKKEMPAMKALEAEYKDNKDIVFMGISVDASKNIQKWKDFVIKEQLPGVQLFAGDMAGPALSKPYKITGIPRFMLVGKDGSLIYMDAPRPSSSEIRAVLNDALKK